MVDAARLIHSDDSIAVVIDVQEKLFPLVQDGDACLKNIRLFIQGAMALKVPVVMTEQAPEKLGKTVAEILSLVPSIQPHKKSSFSACGESAFLAELKKAGKRHIVLTGIETHVCVYQTAIDLLCLGHAVSVVADAVSSRTRENKMIGLEKIKNAGGCVTSVETILFEWLRTSQNKHFRSILAQIK